jgi:hypothetical protein
MDPNMESTPAEPPVEPEPAPEPVESEPDNGEEEGNGEE